MKGWKPALFAYRVSDWDKMTLLLWKLRFSSTRFRFLHGSPDVDKHRDSYCGTKLSWGQKAGRLPMEIYPSSNSTLASPGHKEDLGEKNCTNTIILAEPSTLVALKEEQVF